MNTLEELLKKHWEMGDYDATVMQQQIQALIKESLPAEHEDTDVPSDRLNPQESGEVMGWNDCIDELTFNLRAKGLL